MFSRSSHATFHSFFLLFFYLALGGGALRLFHAELSTYSNLVDEAFFNGGRPHPAGSPVSGGWIRDGLVNITAGDNDDETLRVLPPVSLSLPAQISVTLRRKHEVGVQIAFARSAGGRYLLVLSDHLPGLNGAYLAQNDKRRQLLKTFLALCKARMFMGVVHTVDTLHGLLSPEDKQIRDLGTGYTNEEEDLFKRSAERVIQSSIRSGAKIILIPEVRADDAKSRTSVPYDKIYKRLSAKYGQEGVIYGSVSERFTEQLGARFFIDSVHFNDSGYQFLADQILGLLLQKGLLKARVASPGSGPHPPDALPILR